MNTAKMTLDSTVLVAAFGLALGLMGAPATAHDCTSHKDPNHKHCDTGGGGSPLQFTAVLTTGAFVFGPVVVTPNAKENELRSESNINLNIADTSTPETWDQIFNTCGELLAPDSIDDFTAGDDDWKINKAGGVRVLFIDILLPAKESIDPPLVEVTVQLAGNEFDFNESFLPEFDTDTRTYILDQYIIWGSTLSGTHPRMGCRPPGGGSAGSDDLLPLGFSTLTITASAP